MAHLRRLKGWIQSNAINYSWIKSEATDICLRTADLLIINILSICLFVNFCRWRWNTKRCFLRRITHVRRVATCHFISHLARWQLFPVWNREWTGGVAGMTKHSTPRETERHAVWCWFLPPAQNELSFTRVKIKFTIRMKQTSIGYSVRRYLPIVLFDRNRDSYTTALSFSL